MPKMFESIFNFLTIYAHVEGFLCDIFLSISTSVPRKLAWDIFWHDLPLEGPKVSPASGLSSLIYAMRAPNAKQTQWFFCQLTLKTRVSHNQSLVEQSRKVNFPRFTPTLTLPKLVCHEKCDSFVTTANKCSSLFQDLQAIQCVAQIVRQNYKRA